MADRIIVVEPDALRHSVERRSMAPRPDRQRPGYLDTRVVVARCGLTIAVVGLPEHRPARVTNCPDCLP